MAVDRQIFVGAGQQVVNWSGGGASLHSVGSIIFQDRSIAIAVLPRTSPPEPERSADDDHHFHALAFYAVFVPVHGLLDCRHLDRFTIDLSPETNSFAHKCIIGQCWTVDRSVDDENETPSKPLESIKLPVNGSIRHPGTAPRSLPPSPLSDWTLTFNH